MMTIGDIRAAVTVVTTLREDWPYRAVESAIAKLADEQYDHADILAACVRVARDHQNRAPVTLELKVPVVIAAQHPETTRAATAPRRTDLAGICDICLKPEHICQTTEANSGANRDHDFVSGADAERSRELARARAEEVDRRAAHLIRGIQ